MVDSGDVVALHARVLAALELVHDPGVASLKRVPTVRTEAFRRQCLLAIRHVWGLLQHAYGVRLGRDFYAVHRPGDRLNCLLLTSRLEDAERVRALWPGPPMMVSAVTSMDPMPEAWVAMGVALHWVPLRLEDAEKNDDRV